MALIHILLPLALIHSCARTASAATSAAWAHAATTGSDSGYTPSARAEAVVTHGAARFTVLSEGLLRLEWSPHDPPRFHDAGSFFAVNRRFPVPAFDAGVRADGSLHLQTALLEMVFSPGSAQGGRGFTRETLSVTLKSGVTWHPGDASDASLHGTIRTLDRVGATVGLRCTQPAYLNDSHCEEGVVSRAGWAVIDDSLGPRWDTDDYAASRWPWVTGPAESPAGAPGAPPDPRGEECAARGFDRFECIWGNTVDEAACAARGCCFDAAAAAAADGQPPASHFVPWCFWPQPPAAYTDLYFFGHGHDYTAALADFTSLGGRVPLMPRWALGPHFSRWFAFTDEEEREVLGTHARLGIPLDVQVIDTDWHHGWQFERGFPPHPPRFPDGPPPDAHPIPWTGFDVNAAMLPAARRLHAFLHARGVATGWNLHLPPYVHMSGGVQYIDSAYRALATALGQDADAGLPILGDYSNQTWADAFFELALRPLLVGLDVDFAWPDWQQGEWTRMLGLPPTLWLGYLFAMVLNRWGGLGSHRYPVGFSGDAETTWEVLKLQVYITATAANVAFQWSHDIGGFAGAPGPELMTRWVQMGVFSPVLRPHCAGRGGNQRDIWRFDGTAFAIMRDFFRLRARLVPYLATAQRTAYETGVVPVHPLYYTYPEASPAYDELGLHEHAFGQDIWVAPITAPAPLGGAGLARSDIWFPPGVWFEWFSWQAHGSPANSGAVYERRFALSEAPVFSPAGAIIPLRTLPGSGARTGEGDAVGSAVDVPEALTLWVFPPAPGSLSSSPSGGRSFSARIYDDDGVSVSYASGAFRWTNITCLWKRVLQEEITSDPDVSASALSQDLVCCSIGPSSGDRDFAEMPIARTWTLRFIASWPPVQVLVGGQAALSRQEAVPDAWGDGAAWPAGAAPVWAYAGCQASTWVHTGAPAPVDATLEVAVTFPAGALADDPLLSSALARKIARGQAAKRELNTVGAAMATDAPGVLRVAGTGAVVEAAVAAAHHGSGGGDLSSAATAAMVDSVREAYAGLGAALHDALADVAGLERLGQRGPPIDAMRALLTNALE